MCSPASAKFASIVTILACGLWKLTFTVNSYIKPLQKCFKTYKYCGNTLEYYNCRWTHFSSIGSILVSITTILTSIVAILASIEQVNTPQVTDLSLAKSNTTINNSFFFLFFSGWHFNTRLFANRDRILAFTSSGVWYWWRRPYANICRRHKVWQCRRRVFGPNFEKRSQFLNCDVSWPSRLFTLPCGKPWRKICKWCQILLFEVCLKSL